MAGSVASQRSPSMLPFFMLGGLVLGLAVGLVFPGFGSKLQWIGTAFIRSIQMIVIPIVFSAVTLGVCRMGSHIGKLGRVALISFGYFYAATAVAIVVALLLNGIVHPGLGAGLLSTGKIPSNLALSVDWSKYILDLIPSNIVAAMAEQKILPTLIFACLFGVALATMRERAAPVIAVLETVLQAMFHVTRWIVALGPLAIFAVMAWLFSTQGIDSIFALAKLIGTMYMALIVLVAVFLLVILALGERPLAVARQMAAPVALAFATRSAEVALPLHFEKLEEMGVPNKIVSIVLPLGYSFNLDGSALYIALATTFLAEAYNVTLTWSALATILMTTLIASKGVANVPAGGLVALATVLTSVGLPVEAIAIIAGVDAFMDMGRTAVNVFGNTTAVLLVSKFGGMSDEPSEDYLLGGAFTTGGVTSAA
jgi:dicarboxylate/amino acid:cation (Na+ or H+) symporter, DAACS family